MIKFMENTNKVYTVVAAGLTLWLAKCFFTWYRLRHFKGPFLAVSSKLWIVKCTWQQNLHTELKRLCDELGEVPSCTVIAASPPLILFLLQRARSTNQSERNRYQ